MGEYSLPRLIDCWWTNFSALRTLGKMNDSLVSVRYVPIDKLILLSFGSWLYSWLIDMIGSRGARLILPQKLETKNKNKRSKMRTNHFETQQIMLDYLFGDTFNCRWRFWCEKRLSIQLILAIFDSLVDPGGWNDRVQGIYRWCYTGMLSIRLA